MKMNRLCLVACAVCMTILFSFALANANTYVVTNANDSGDGSLRWAIEQANLNSGEDTITFDNSYTIYPLTVLPPLSDTAYGTTIDGGDYAIIIDGSSMPNADYGFQIASDNNVIMNVEVRSIYKGAEYPYGRGFGIWVLGDYNTIYGCKIYLNDESGIRLGEYDYWTSTNIPANYNKIQACYIGTSDGVTIGEGNLGGGIYGHTLNVTYTIIGVDGDGLNDDNEGNVISGNSSPGGIFIGGPGTRIAGNLIGVDKTGTVALPNTGTAGIAETGKDAVIGTDGDGVSDDLEGNVISGNEGFGVKVSPGSRFSGNHVGVDITGTVAIPNQGRWGVGISIGSNMLIGTDGDGQSDELERNIVSGNVGGGIVSPWSHSGSFENVRISGNYVGTDVTGTQAIGNGGFGIGIHPIGIDSCTNFYIGTNGDGVNDDIERNIISGHRHWRNGIGVYIGPEKGYAGIQVSGNYIGTDVTGTVALPNTYGVKLYRTTDNIIGTDGDGTADDVEGNVIVGANGAILFDDWYGNGADNNRVSGNYCGVDKTGAVVLGKGTIQILSSHNNIIGTNGDGLSDDLERNVIAGGDYGLHMIQATGSRISGNYIGLAADGITPLGFSVGGINLFGSNNTIGTDGDGTSDALEGNIIVADVTLPKSSCGILIRNSDNCRISGNFIGTNKTGTLVAGFGGAGIHIRYGDNNLVGTDWDGVSDELEGNVIANNGYSPYTWWYENDGVNVLGQEVCVWDSTLGECSYEEQGNYNAIRGNSIYNNAGLGIDLIDIANKQIVPPVITSAILSGSDVVVSGTAPVGSTVEVFVADADSSGAGEGKTYKGKAEATTDGNFTINVTGIGTDDLITATATDSTGNTSEFAVNVGLTGNRPPELAPIGDMEVDEGALLTFTVSASDPDGDPVDITCEDLPGGSSFADGAFAWTPDYTQAGVYPVTFIASDDKEGFDSETIDITVNAVNSPPGAAPSGGGTYYLLTDIILSGQVSDYDGDILSYRWYEGDTEYCSGTAVTLVEGDAVDLPGCVIYGGLSVGTHTIVLEVSDGVNDPVIASIEVTVIDTSAPTLAPEANTAMLWPPNHGMVDITIITNAADDSGCFTLSAEVTSNEPDNGLGDGDIGPDFTEPIINQETGVITLQLRAERSGKGDGRVYAIEITATDCSENSSHAVVEIACPHDKRNK